MAQEEAKPQRNHLQRPWCGYRLRSGDPQPWRSPDRDNNLDRTVGDWWTEAVPFDLARVSWYDVARPRHVPRSEGCIACVGEWWGRNP